jgi:hypothetical protein
VKAPVVAPLRVSSDLIGVMHALDACFLTHACFLSLPRAVDLLMYMTTSGRCTRRC